MNWRLLIGGCATLLLLFWITFVADTLPGVIVSPLHSPSATRILVSAFFCVLAIVPFAVALVRGSPTARVTSAVALIFPSIVFLWVALGTLGR